MKTINDKKYPAVKQEKNVEEPSLPGYPTYGEKEDIYTQAKEEIEIDPENIKQKKTNEEIGEMNKLSFDQDHSGKDLDVPGSELDDDQEKIGSEDEENNLYSLGGDNHSN